MATRFLVKQIKTCHVCNGKGRVQHPAWVEYWSDPKHQNKSLMSLESDLQWFKDHGWMESPGYWLEQQLNGLPDEEIICRECNGEKYIETETDLFTALRAYSEMEKCAANIGDDPCICGWH